MTGVSYATSAEMAARARAVPRLRSANAADMLRVIRNHRRAAYGHSDGYEKLATAPVPLDHAACPDERARSRRRRAPGTAPSRSARSTASATRRRP